MPVGTIPGQPISPVDALAQRLGIEWPNLVAARERTELQLNQLADALKDHTSPDTSVVVYGSLARKEFTQGSDLDWTLLVDGQANPQHQSDLLRIREELYRLGKQPGKEKTFGKLTFSHPILHMIGGEDDSNTNTTRRVLLLLEAYPLGEHRQAFDRVRTNILRRYLTEDHGLSRKIGAGHLRSTPLFLLNDMARYWRTMTVDFAYKQRDRGNEGYALRSIKLGISRKLIFASGLLACYWCAPEISKTGNAEFRLAERIPRLNKDLVEMFTLTPLERFARFFQAHFNNSYFVKTQAAIKFFQVYDEFLGLLHDESKRKHLEELAPNEMDEDTEFQSARAIRTRFAEAIRMVFLEPESPLYQHTISTGVF